MVDTALAGSEYNRLLALIDSGLISLPVESGLSYWLHCTALAGSEHSRLLALIGSGLVSLPAISGLSQTHPTIMASLVSSRLTVCKD